MAAAVNPNVEVAPMEVDEAKAEVKAQPPKRSLACLQKLFLKNGGRRMTSVDFKSLRAEIEAQTAKIRLGKRENLRETNPREWWSIVRKLLLLKYDSELFNGDVNTVSMTNPGDLFTEIKLRWWVKNPDGTSKRLQRPVQCRTSLTAAEILSLVTEFTAARFPQLGGPLSIAVRSDLLDLALRYPKNSPEAKSVCPDPEAMRTLCLDDVLTLPLEFPGPCLPNSTTVDLDVTFAAPPSNISTPECYTAEEQKTSLPELVDAGVNLCDKELKEHPLAVLHEAAAAGVSQAVAMSVDMESSRFNVLVARSAGGNAFAAIGVHPTCIPKDVKPEDAVKELDEMIETDKKRGDGKKRIVAIGEIGLDYEKDNGVAHDVQLQWFDQQLQLACKHDMPVILHLRGPEAFVQGKELLRSRGKSWHGSINCFDGTLEDMREFVEMGLYITWTGLLCNENRAEVLREVVAKGSPENYLLGSDAPHLIPFTMNKPYPKCNRPCTLPHVAALVANLLKMPVQQVASLTTANARAAFKLPTVVYNGSLPAEGIKHDASVFVEAPLVDMPKKAADAEAGKKGKKLRILSDEEVAALVPPGMLAFVDQGFVFGCQPGVKNALDALAAGKDKNALKQSINEFTAAGLMVQLHDPHVRKHAKKHKNRVRDRAQGRAVRRRVAGHGRYVVRHPVAGRGGRGGVRRRRH